MQDKVKNAEEKKRQLTKKERLFVFEYLADEKMNAENAAIKAGYSPSVARTKAYVWVSKSKQNKKIYIADAVEEMMKQKLESLDVESMRVLNEIKKIAFFNPIKIIEQLGDKSDLTIATLKNIDPDLFAGVSEILIEDGIAKIKVSGKLKALELLGKRLKLWESISEGTKFLLEVQQGSAEDDRD